MKLKRTLLQFLFVAVPLSIFSNSCSSTPKTYVLPSNSDYQGYQIIDAVEKDTVAVELDKGERIAVVVRDITTTSYSYLEPRYMNSMVKYEGRSQCCRTNSLLIGNTGLAVYKFSFIGKGDTRIELISRQKGLSTTVTGFDTDHLISVNVKVN